MKEIRITEEESGQRLDKLLARYMRDAPKSFLYKMLRKKNITLNGKKAEGKEQLQPGDRVKLFLSDETYIKFGGIPLEAGKAVSSDRESAGEPKPAELQMCAPARAPVLEQGVEPPAIVYQDRHILLFNKPAGLLSQKADAGDISLVEYLNAWLLSSGQMTRKTQLVHPAICNRLDRNTSGLVAAGISLAGLQTLNQLLRERTIRKYYRCLVCGTMPDDGHLCGYLQKDARTNTVQVTDFPSADAKPIETAWRVLASENGLTLLEVHLITGRSHQIRAHLASIGHPILGDTKYGDAEKTRAFAHSHGVHSQLLHAYRMEFPEVEGTLSYLSGKIFCAPMPEVFCQIMPDAASQDEIHDRPKA